MTTWNFSKEVVDKLVTLKIFKTEDEALKVLGTDLPLLAKHFDLRILGDLRKENEWLTWLEDDPVTHWDDLRNLFLEDGLKCLDTLDSFTTALRCKSIDTLMMNSSVGAFYALAMFNIDRFFKGGANSKIAKSLHWITIGDEDRMILFKKIETELRTADVDDKNDAGRERLREISTGRIWMENYEGKYRKSIYANPEVTPFENEPLGRQLDHRLEDLKRALETKSVEFKEYYHYKTYSGNVKQFVREVGCSKTGETPEENIVELRLFYYTTICFVAKLQKNYLKKDFENKKLNRAIVALEFRYLLEHLPDPKSAGDGAGGRWMNFWERALQNEANDHLNSDSFPNKYLVEVMESYNPNSVDGKTKVINKEHQKGYLFRMGKDLYNHLSSEIHRYRSTAYEIGDDLALTKPIQDILRALKPEKYKDGEVDWEEERKRYV
ncbi:hypothetical protein MMC22_005421 [Lobaria immixta]|nr:hypothetical protein [Lobaria immixta]